MAKIAQPLFDRGYFESLVMDRNRLYSQVLDNLNKAALVGFPHTEIATRLSSAWVGKPEQVIHYEQAQECANLFRAYCLEHNLLDFSLQLDTFNRCLWPSHLVRSYLAAQYQFLIYDNVEEDYPVAHDILREWLPDFKSALLVNDSGAGYRAFLGADPESGAALASACSRSIELNQSFVSDACLQDFNRCFSGILLGDPPRAISPQVQKSFTFQPSHFYPEMIEWVAHEIACLVHDEHVPAGEIAVVSPFLSDSLQHTLTHLLEGLGIAARTSRPSRSLSADPAARCLFTLARLAHPLWEMPVTPSEVRVMLMQAISGLDLVRADLLSSILFRRTNNLLQLNSFDPLAAGVQERITYSIGERYMQLYHWLEEYVNGEPVELDVFFARLFGEVLSQNGFGFHENFDAASITAHLIESVQKFRRVADTTDQIFTHPLGQEYLLMAAAGVIAAQYLPPLDNRSVQGVLIAPGYTFLMNNQPVKIQFWLDIGSLGWWERLFQPLTHPYVLSRHWQPGTPWTDAQDFRANQQTLQRLTAGLISRCREHIYLCSSRVSENGSEEKGPLLFGMQTLRRLVRESGGDHV
jgi:hypothetical protein